MPANELSHAGLGFRQIRRHLLLKKVTRSLSSPVHPPKPLSGFPAHSVCPSGHCFSGGWEQRGWVFQGHQTYLFSFAAQTACVKATQTFAIKEKLAGKDMAKAAYILPR